MTIARSLLPVGSPPPNDGLVLIYKQAIAELQQRMRQRLLAEPARATVESQRARVLLGEAADILNDLNEAAAEWIRKNIPDAYVGGMRKAEAGLDEIGAPYTDRSIRPGIHRQAVEVLAATTEERVAQATAEIAAGVREVVRKTQLGKELNREIVRMVGRSVVTGKTRRELSKEIKRRLIEEFAGGPVVINGRRYGADAYASLVARTMNAEAATAGTVNRLIEEGHDLVMVDAHGATDACGIYEGKVFSISGRDSRYPALNTLPNGGPPFHPNCKHDLLPFVEALASRAEIKRGSGVPSSALNKSFAAVEKAHRRAA